MTTTKEKNEKALFKFKEADEQKMVFQRAIKEEGRSKKEIQQAVSELPTATFSIMSESDFEKLKKIEKELNANSPDPIKKEKKSFRDFIFWFLEIG